MNRSQEKGISKLNDDDREAAKRNFCSAGKVNKKELETQKTENKTEKDQDYIEQAQEYTAKLIKKYQALGRILTATDYQKIKKCTAQYVAELRNKMVKKELAAKPKKLSIGNPLLSTNVCANYKERYEKGKAPWWRPPIPDTIMDTIAFAEVLGISKMGKPYCPGPSDGNGDIFEENDPIGTFKIFIKRNDSNFEITSQSDFPNNTGISTRGHNESSLYDRYLKLIRDERVEFELVEEVKIQKKLEVRLQNHEWVTLRKIEISDKECTYECFVDQNVGYFMLDCGVFLLMRYLVLTKFEGIFEYWTMNLKGELQKCKFMLHYDVPLMVGEKSYTAISVRKLLCKIKQDIPDSVTYFTPEGRMIVHVWNSCNLILTADIREPPPEPPPWPQLELTWTTDKDMMIEFEKEKEFRFHLATEYFNMYHEITESLFDFMLCLLHTKPKDVYKFATKFFQTLNGNRK